MIWRKEVKEIKHRHQLVERGGIPERIERQRAQGKMTVRERIAALIDPGSFQEIGGLSGHETHERDKLVAVMPLGAVIGWGTLSGRQVLIHGDDSTVRQDMFSGITEMVIHKRKLGYGETLALHHRLPYIRLLDAPGASVRAYEKKGRPEFVSLNQWIEASARLLTIAPVVSLVMGSIGGKPAIEACLCHFNVMVRGTGHVFPGGPPVVKAALGYDINKEDLGGVGLLAYNGVIDRVAENEAEAFTIARQFLSYLPDNAWEMPPHIEPGDDPNRRDKELLSVIPRESEKPYDPYEILNHILDHDSLFEIAPLSGQSTITALARVNGYPVGVIIRNPESPTAGAMDVVAVDKVSRLLQLCDTFHLPIVCFADELGLLPGIDSEKQGIVRAGARLVQAIYETKTPWLSIIIRQAYGAAGSMNFRPYGMSRSYAWPSVHWGSTKPGGGDLPTYGATEAFGVEAIIDPRDTRPLLCNFIEASQSYLGTQLSPGVGPSYRL